MADLSNSPPTIAPPKQMNRHIFAILAVLSLVAGAGLWCWFNQTVEESLKLGGMETPLQGRPDRHPLRRGREKAPDHQRRMDPPTGRGRRKAEPARIGRRHHPGRTFHEGGRPRQVTMMDCQILHLFVKPEVAAQGFPGLRKRMIFLGSAGSGVHCVGEEILKFFGLTAGTDYVEDPRNYEEMMKSPPGAMPDAVFSLSPLPSPMGEKLVRQYGYQLMELPMGESLALRRPCFEDAVIPADMYGATPPVPQAQIHTVGVRGMLVANKSVSSLAIERLLEVFYESDFRGAANLKKMDPALLKRSGEYPFHLGTFAYMHRGDPLHLKEVLAKVQGLIGSMFSVLSAILLAWQWIRRKKLDVGEYQQECTNLDLDAQRAACQGEFGDAELGACVTHLAKLKADVLERYHVQFMAGDKAVVALIARIEELQHLLPNLGAHASSIQANAVGLWAAAQESGLKVE